MFPADRQVKLDPIIVALQAVPGVLSVTPDDWDSAGRKVFVQLQYDARSYVNGKPTQFAYPLRRITNGIRRALKGVARSELDVPEQTYENGGDGLKYRVGYDKTHVHFVVYV